MTLSAVALCEAFRDRAAAVHELVSYSYACGLGVSEETITDVTLVELRRRLHPHVLAQKFTKQQESSTSGADWLMTIGRPGRWISLLVQAKLARPGKDRIDKLHYGKGAQRQTLVAYARQQNFLPLYVIYTGFSGVAAKAPRTTVKKRRTKQGVPVWTPPCPATEDIKQMGCVAMRPRHVALMFRGKAPKNGVVDVLNRGRPWCCLFCCPNSTPQTELADAMAAGFGQLPIDSPAPLSPGGIKVPDPDDNFADPNSLIAQDPPDVVARMLQGQPVGHAPLAGAIVVSSTPIDVLLDDSRPARQG